MLIAFNLVLTIKKSHQARLMLLVPDMQIPPTFGRRGGRRKVMERKEITLPHPFCITAQFHWACSIIQTIFIFQKHYRGAQRMKIRHGAFHY